MVTRRRLLAGALSIPAWVSRPVEAFSSPKRTLERSYWLHASLGQVTQNGYWGREFPRTVAPTQLEVRSAARLLTGRYGAGRLYLIYHDELPAAEALQVFRWWREACPREVELVPTLVLRMYDRAQTPVFTPESLRAFCRGLRNWHAGKAAIYDIHPNRDQGPCLTELQQTFKGGVLRVGLQPGETLPSTYSGAVEDTWSAFCHGFTQEDWEAKGFGRDTLRTWIEERNAGAHPISWDLITVAWDYSVTRRGEYPGYDDAEKNMPLPVGRNRLAAAEIRSRSLPSKFAGFSSDLFILHVNSAGRKHDGASGTFYQSLKSGKPYIGYFAAPLDEIAQIYRDLRG